MQCQAKYFMTSQTLCAVRTCIHCNGSGSQLGHCTTVYLGIVPASVITGHSSEMFQQEKARFQTIQIAMLIIMVITIKPLLAHVYGLLRSLLRSLLSSLNLYCSFLVKNLNSSRCYSLWMFMTFHACHAIMSMFYPLLSQARRGCTKRESRFEVPLTSTVK